MRIMDIQFKDRINEEIVKEANKEMEDYFIERTMKHIHRVQDNAKKIEDAYPLEFQGLRSQTDNHDQSKLEEPEKTPYISITWRHKIEQSKGEFDPISGKGYQTPGLLKKEDENKATLHHVTTNPHHPEYWLKDKGDANINQNDRDKSDKCVDASRMEDKYVAEMVADWQSMADELKKNTAREWFDKQKDVRWHFSEHQCQLIDKLLKVFETDKKEYGRKAKQQYHKSIAVDFDNTIAHLEKFPAIGEPIPGVQEALQKLKDMGYEIVIYTCRANSDQRETSAEQVKEYLDQYKIPYDRISKGSEGKPMALYYIDDRAIKFDNNWDAVVQQIIKDKKNATKKLSYQDDTVHDRSEAEVLWNSFKPLDTLPKWALEDEFGYGQIPQTITVYHYGKEIVKGKPIVTSDDRYYAEEFKDDGDKLFEFRNVPLNELRVMGEGRISTKNRHTGTKGREFLYMPK